MGLLGSRAHVTLPGLVAALATGVALFSSWHTGGRVWRSIGNEFRTYSAYSSVQEQHAPLDKLTLPSQVFDFYAANLRPGDRIYFQVKPGPFGEFFDFPQIVAAAGRFDLLPAVQAPDLAHATVVLSYDVSPKLLHLRPTAQYRTAPFYVTRLSG